MTKGAAALTCPRRSTAAAAGQGRTTLANARNHPSLNGIVKTVRKAEIALLVAMSLGACESEGVEEIPSPITAEIDPQNPCDLLSPEQVGAAIKTEVRDEEEVDSHDLVTRICSYKTTKPWSSVGLSLEDGISRDEFDERVRRDPPNTEPVGGIGDGAFIHGCSGIFVYTGQVLVSAGVQHLTTCEETSIVLKSLARTIVNTLNETGTP
jgi:hypothetical protein